MGKAAELREQAAAKFKEAHDIVAGRDPAELSEEDERRFDTAMAEGEKLQKQYLRAAGQASGTSRDMLSPMIPFPGGRGVPRDGLAVLAPNEKLSAMTGASEYGLGELVRAIVTGDNSRGVELKAAMGVGTGAAGGFLVPEPLSADVIDRARAQARVLQAGARTIPMTASTLKIARVTGDPSAAWKLENAAGPASDMTLDRVEMTARTLVSHVKASVELLEDSENAQDVIERSLGAALALELDRAALRGSGTAPEPRGIRNATGVNIQSMGVNGAALTNYDPFSTAVQTIQAANGQPGAIIYSPRTAGVLDRLKDTTNQPLRPPPSFEERAKLPTSQIPENLTHGTATTATEAYVGQWDELLIGVRRELVIEVSRQAADSTDSAWRQLQVFIRAYLRADIALAQPSHFTVITGIL